MLLRNNKILGTVFFITSLLTFSLLSTVAEANIRNVTGSLKLTATINHQPAFSAVSWQITLKRPGSAGGNNQFFQVINQHSTTLDLDPGHYRVVLNIGGKKESRDITIIESKHHRLVINIDR